MWDEGRPVSRLSLPGLRRDRGSRDRTESNEQPTGEGSPMWAARQSQSVDPCGQPASSFDETQAGHGEIQMMNCRMEEHMKQILPVCCFCQKVRDDTGTEAGRGLWQELRIYMVAHKVRPEDINFSHTYCHDCLKDDPRAIPLRAESGQPVSSVLGNG